MIHTCSSITFLLWSIISESKRGSLMMDTLKIECVICRLCTGSEVLNWNMKKWRRILNHTEYCYLTLNSSCVYVVANASMLSIGVNSWWSSDEWFRSTILCSDNHCPLLRSCRLFFDNILFKTWGLNFFYQFVGWQ